MKKLLILLTGLILIHGDAWCAYCADNAESGPRTTPASQRGQGRKITAAGVVEPEEVVEIGAQVAGAIVNLGEDPRVRGKRIDYGSPVEMGTVLAQIDSESITARIQLARATCARAEAELAQAKIKLDRAEAQLQHAQAQKNNNSISDAEFDLTNYNCKLAKAAVTVAEAVLVQDKAALQQVEIELGYTTIRSPIKGVVIDRRVTVGQIVAPAANAPGLFLVGNLEKLQVWASVNEADISQIREQQTARFTVDAFPGKVFEGKVKQVRLNAAMTRNTVTYTVVITVSSETTKLLPYLTAHVEFE